MSRLNPIADGMSTLKNAADKGRPECVIEPASKLLGSMFRIMQDSGYLTGFDYIDDGRGGQFVVHLNGRINKCGAICPRYSVHSMNWNTLRSSSCQPRTSVCSLFRPHAV